MPVRMTSRGFIVLDQGFNIAKSIFRRRKFYFNSTRQPPIRGGFLLSISVRRCCKQCLFPDGFLIVDGFYRPLLSAITHLKICHIFCRFCLGRCGLSSSVVTRRLRPISETIALLVTVIGGQRYADDFTVIKTKVYVDKHKGTRLELSPRELSKT